MSRCSGLSLELTRTPPANEHQPPAKARDHRRPAARHGAVAASTPSRSGSTVRAGDRPGTGAGAAGAGASSRPRGASTAAARRSLGAWLQERARQRVRGGRDQISETETPLHRLETVYRRLVATLSTADVPVGAIRAWWTPGSTPWSRTPSPRSSVPAGSRRFARSDERTP